MTTEQIAPSIRRSWRWQVIGWLVEGILCLMGAFNALALVTSDVWPLVPICLLWSLGFGALVALGWFNPSVLKTTARFCVLGSNPWQRPNRWRQRIWISMCRLKTLWYVGLGVTLVSLAFAPAIFAGFRYGPLAGEAAFVVLFVFLHLVLGINGSRSSRRKQVADELEERRLRGWPCPHCGETFGPDALLVRYGSAGSSDLPPSSERPHVIFRCAKCQFGYQFNAAGGILIETGNEWEELSQETE
jgi:hypothetical protein